MSLRVLSRERWGSPRTGEHVNYGSLPLCQAFPVQTGVGGACRRYGKEKAEDGPKSTRYPFTWVCRQHWEIGKRDGIEWVEA